MCLIISNQRMNRDITTRRYSNRDALASTRPLLVKKWLWYTNGNDFATTPFRKFKMFFGQRYDEVGKRFQLTHCIIDGGGFHSLDWTANHRNCSWLDHSDAVFPAIIPPGTKLFLGEDHDIVSKSLIVYKTMADLTEVWGRPILRRDTKKVIHYTTRSE